MTGLVLHHAIQRATQRITLGLLVFEQFEQPMRGAGCCVRMFAGAADRAGFAFAQRSAQRVHILIAGDLHSLQRAFGLLQPAFQAGTLPGQRLQRRGGGMPGLPERICFLFGGGQITLAILPLRPAGLRALQTRAQAFGGGLLFRQRIRVAAGATLAGRSRGGISVFARQHAFVQARRLLRRAFARARLGLLQAQVFDFCGLPRGRCLLGFEQQVFDVFPVAGQCRVPGVRGQPGVAFRPRPGGQGVLSGQRGVLVGLRRDRLVCGCEGVVRGLALRCQQGDFGIQPLGGLDFRLPCLLCLSGRCKLLPCLIERDFSLGSRLIGGDAAGLQRLQLRGGLLCRFVQARAFGMQGSRRLQRADMG